MANLIQQGSGEKEEKVIKVELPDGTSGEIPIQDASLRTEIVKGYGKGGEIKEYKKGKKVSKKKKKK